MFTPWDSTIDVEQIRVGFIEKVHGDPASNAARFDIRFCPQKGEKPQHGTIEKRADTFNACRDIESDMAFNKSYKSRKGGKVEILIKTPIRTEM